MEPQQAGTGATTGAYIAKTDAQPMIDLYQAGRAVNEKVCFFIDAPLMQNLLDQNPIQLQVILAFNGTDNTLVITGTDGSTNHIYYKDMVLENVQPFNRTGQEIPGEGPQVKPNTTLE